MEQRHKLTTIQQQHYARAMRLYQEAEQRVALAKQAVHDLGALILDAHGHNPLVSQGYIDETTWELVVQAAPQPEENRLIPDEPPAVEGNT